MKWMGRAQSDNVEDRRGMPVGGMVAGGGLGTLAIVVIAMFLGVDPGVVLNNLPPAQQQQAGPAQEQQNDESKQFVAVVLADTETVWTELFQQQFKRAYQKPHLVLFSGQVQTACGNAGASVGPFYCPGDQKVYLDLSFFDELRERFKAPGDFAAAYVIAHEVGHHVQNQLGVMDRVHSARGRGDKNQQSVRLELQADFLAGVWAHHAQKSKQILEAGDLDEAIGAAGAVGDDRLQKQAQGTVTPDTFTHGSAAQRIRWFRRGFDTGDLSLMDELFEMPYNEL